MATKFTKVITYISGNEQTIDVCEECAEKELPRDTRGSHYAQVSRGLHIGGCQICGAGLAPWEETLA